MSPNSISSVATESFSLTIGIAPSFKSSSNVLRALCRLRSSIMVNFVIRICAVYWLYSENSFWYTVMSLLWPIAAHACLSEMESGFSFRPSDFLPTPMAPDDTTMISFPLLCRSVRMRTNFSSFTRSSPPVSSWMIVEVPTLNTILFLSLKLFLIFLSVLSSLLLCTALYDPERYPQPVHRGRHDPAGISGALPAWIKTAKTFRNKFLIPHDPHRR